MSLLLRGLLGNLDLVALLGAYYLMAHMVKLRAASQGFDPTLVADLAFWVAVGALVGGRLGYVLPAVQNYIRQPLDLVRINGGMYFYGALTGGLIFGAWSARRSALPFWSISDAFALYAPAVIAITRISCLLGNECYGARAPAPLGIVFPGLTQPRYPSELYEGLVAILIFGSLLWLSQRNLLRGTLFLTFLIAYPLGRAVVDVTRLNLGTLGAADIYVSVAVALAAAAVLFVRRVREDKAIPTSAPLIRVEEPQRDLGEGRK
ncbi:MAG: prolipoprotein diacylglyceryl transferase [Dehalococcoidia bacterium]